MSNNILISSEKLKQFELEKRITLEKVEITDLDVEELTKIQSVKSITLSEILGTQLDLTPLSALSHLTHINLHGNHRSIRPFLDKLGSFADLTSLVLSMNEIDDDGVQKITVCKKLVELDLSKNSITDHGAMIIASAFPTLKKLALTYNFLQDDGIMAVVANMRSLEDLRLGFNHPTPQGISAALEALQSTPSLRVLGLSIHPQLFTFAMDFPVSPIAALLCYNPALERLSLVNFRLGDAYAIEIAKAVSDGSALKLVDIRGWDTTGLTLVAFAEAVQRNDTLERLAADDHSVSQFCHDFFSMATRGKKLKHVV